MQFKDAVVFVTGGAGFIGSAVVRHLLDDTEAFVVNIDKLTYAANLDSIPQANGHSRYRFAQVDICNGPALRKLFDQYNPRYVMNLAAESHVDRSIDEPGRIYPDQYRRHIHAAAGGTALLARARSAQRSSASASITSRPTRSTALSAPRGSSPRQPPTHRTRPTPPLKPRQTISSRSGAKLTACRRSLPIVRTITVPITSRKSSFPTSSSRAWRRNRCRFTATARTSATGSMWRITRER